MIARYVSNQPNSDIIIKEVIAVTVEWNISEVCTVLNINFPPGNLIFASVYAAKEAINRCPNVPITEVNTVLNIYLEKGTQDIFISENSDEKFSNVGFCT
jgi:hypothetical protein